MKTVLFTALVISTLVPQAAYSVDRCSAIFERAPVSAQLSRKKLESDLSFMEKKEKVEEHSIREGDTAAHVYLDSTVASDPYLFVAFPAGNSGVALFFKSAGTSFIEAISGPRALQKSGGLNGIEIDLKTGSQDLLIDDSMLGSLRFIRDRELGKDILTKSVGKLYDAIMKNRIVLEDGKLYYARKGLNGVTKYLTQIEPANGTRIVQEGATFRLVSGSEVKFKLTAMTSEKPLTPIALNKMFKPDALAKMDQKRLIALSFLAYKEKLMAGSPRYFSKFGRDSIYSLRVLMDSMQPEAIESLLTATISSINPRTGLVSHEQHEGDFTSFVRVKQKQKVKGVTDPIEDYKMVDDDLAFTFVMGEYLKSHPERAKEMLDRKDARGIEQRELVSKLFRFVKKQGAGFANDPTFSNLIGLKGHEMTGQWRDSEAGLGEGKYPFDVNAVFMPAALKALRDLAMDASPGNEFYNLKEGAELNRMHEVWNTKVIPLFEVRVNQAELEGYAKQFWANTGRDLKTLPPAPKEDVVFTAISLGKDGKPVPIMHSDDSIMMTFGTPSEAYLKQITQRVRLPFPYGLRTEIGILVSSPLFASKDLQIKFGKDRYHGEVIWTMQEDLMVYGMARQIRSDATSAKMKAELKRDIRLIEGLIEGRGDLGGIEVFSIKHVNGRAIPESFAGDAKGNSNQLWGHLRLVFPELLKNLDLHK